MLADGAARHVGPSILSRLRSETGAAHQALEDSLALLEPPLRRARFVSALAGFRSFHRDWEPRVEALIGDPALLVGRRKLSLLDSDLAALGLQAPDTAADFDLDFLKTPEAAWGSLYVLEGSTLGGQVIFAALRGVDWLPEGGLSYFNPYGPRTGFMWRQFRDAVEAQALDAEAASAGACATFATLKAGLAQARDLVA